MMQKSTIGTTGITISRVGIGGHYKVMEEGQFDERFGSWEREVEERTPLVERAFKSGINYFDTTWRNEVALLGKVLNNLKIRDRVFVNGMVLGAFRGSKAAGQTVEDYFNKWLDDRLQMMPDHRFDSFMINAIEEDFDDLKCERLIKLLDKRQAAGDLSFIGFSCHDPALARELADRYKVFQIIMVPYNYRNRKFEQAFNDYPGFASFIIMKPLVWTEYGIPFCALNQLSCFEQVFGTAPVYDAATRAFRFILNNPQVCSVVSAVNSLQELDCLIAAADGSFSLEDERVLKKYNELVTYDKGVPLFLSGLGYDNLRLNFWSVLNLSRILGLPTPAFSLNKADSREKIMEYAGSIMEKVRAQGYGRYVGKNKRK